MIGIVPAVPVALAQDLLPELAAPAAQHKAADEALDKQKLEAIALAAKSYVSALDGVEKSATAKGEIDLVAAVVKEREAVASGALEPDLPAALPKARLQMSRKTLLASVERINADFAKRKKKADADYLRILATLQPRAASNPELAKQLAAEKAAVLGNGSGVSGVGSPAVKKAHGKNVVVNLKFEQVADGKPDNWSLPICATVVAEGNNTFCRFDDKVIITREGAVPFFCSKREIEFPKDAKTVNISAKIRTTNCVSPKTEPRYPKAQVSFEDQAGKPFFYLSASWDKKNGPWKTIHAEESPIPKEAVKAFVILTNGRCSGQIDFDDIEVTFK